MAHGDQVTGTEASPGADDKDGCGEGRIVACFGGVEGDSDETGMDMSEGGGRFLELTRFRNSRAYGWQPGPGEKEDAVRAVGSKEDLGIKKDPVGYGASRRIHGERMGNNQGWGRPMVVGLTASGGVARKSGDRT